MNYWTVYMDLRTPKLATTPGYAPYIIPGGLDYGEPLILGLTDKGKQVLPKSLLHNSFPCQGGSIAGSWFNLVPCGNTWTNIYIFQVPDLSEVAFLVGFCLWNNFGHYTLALRFAWCDYTNLGLPVPTGVFKWTEKTDCLTPVRYQRVDTFNGYGQPYGGPIVVLDDGYPIGATIGDCRFEPTMYTTQSYPFAPNGNPELVWVNGVFNGESGWGYGSFNGWGFSNEFYTQTMPTIFTARGVPFTLWSLSAQQYTQPEV